MAQEDALYIYLFLRESFYRRNTSGEAYIFSRQYSPSNDGSTISSPLSFWIREERYRQVATCEHAFQKPLINAVIDHQVIDRAEVHSLSFNRYILTFG